MTRRRYSHVIWDWNGTLFDDVDWCLHVINTLLRRRALPTLADVRAYHEVFCFPIVEYYKNVSFDLAAEPFEVLAEEYIRLYHSADAEHCALFDDARRVLQQIQAHGIAQTVLSASEQSNLLHQMSPYGIGGFFDEILGISDIYAHSKVENGLDYMARSRVEHAVLIGDTAHDFEVAQALGIDCILVARGHQSRERLLTCTDRVAADLGEALQHVLSQ